MKTAIQSTTQPKMLCASAKATGVVIFNRRQSRFEKYARNSSSTRKNRSSVKYSTAKNHYDALVRKFYREARLTDKTSSREEVMVSVEEKVHNHLKMNRLYYDFDTLANPVKEPSKTESYNMNMIQRAMYRRLMYGLSEFTPEQIADLTPRFEKKVAHEHRITKRAIQIMKAKILYGFETRLINAMFQHLTIGNTDFEWIMDIPKKHTLRTLGISTRDVVDELIRRRLLPADFHELDLTKVSL